MPVRPRLLFIRIELTGNWPTCCWVDESAEVYRLYSMSISLLSKKSTALSRHSDKIRKVYVGKAMVVSTKASQVIFSLLEIVSQKQQSDSTYFSALRIFWSTWVTSETIGTRKV